MCGHSRSIGSFTFMIMSLSTPGRWSRRRGAIPLGADSGICLVRETASKARARLDEHRNVRPRRAPSAPAPAHEGDTILVGLDLFRNADFHGKSRAECCWLWNSSALATKAVATPDDGLNLISLDLLCAHGAKAHDGEPVGRREELARDARDVFHRDAVDQRQQFVERAIRL